MRLDSLDIKWEKIREPDEFLESTSHTMFNEPVLRGEVSGKLYRVSVSWNTQRAVWYRSIPAAYDVVNPSAE